MSRDLKILQYNVHCSKDEVLVPLLEDKTVQDFDILAIQEPWENRFVTTGYNPSSSKFTLCYPPFRGSRVCLYLNKRLRIKDWKVTNHSKDVQTATIRTEAWNSVTTTLIHNVYNPSPPNRHLRESDTMETVRNCLQMSGERHILLGDFNLHHPLWEGPERNRRHELANTLLEVTQEKRLQLVTNTGEPTWRARGTFSTLDLTFLSPTAMNDLIRHGTRHDLEQGSDHIPIETIIRNGPQRGEVVIKKDWKNTNIDELLNNLRFDPQQPVTTRNEIDHEVDNLTNTITVAIGKSVPDKTVSQWSNGYWNQECSEAVKRSRQAFSEWLRLGTDEAYQTLQEAKREKKRIIRRSKRTEFRKTLREELDKDEKIWRLAKWAKQRANQPHSLPQLPDLVVNGRTVSETEEKFEALKESLFPKPNLANHEDIDESTYPRELDTEPIVTEDEVTAAIQRVSKDKAPGPDGIPNRILKIATERIAPKLAVIFTACINLGYHPKIWKQATTIALKKVNKKDHSTPKAYRPIALLNTCGKLLELVVAQRLTQLAETNRLLPETQMGARKKRSTGLALRLLTEYIHTVWSKPGKPQVVTMLCTDLEGAFPNTSHRRIIASLRQRGIPRKLTEWIESFLTDRKTTIKTMEGESRLLTVETGIPQGSPLSPILFLFFVADLMDTIKREGPRTTPLGFVDDINILTYGYSTERNCKALEKIHRKCQEWAEKSGAKFALDKYELIHFTRARRHNTKAPIQLGPIRLEPKDTVRILGVQIDRKLRWKPHLQIIENKAESLLVALSRIKASTWGGRVHRMKRIYQTMIRPALTFGATAWYQPPEIGKGRKWMYKLLNGIQSKFLKRVVGAYRATNRLVIEKELEIQPITSYLTELVVSAHQKEKEQEMHQLVKNMREKLLANTRARGTKRLTPQEELEKWISREGLNQSPQPSGTPSDQDGWQKRLRKYLRNQDRETWEQYQQKETTRNHRVPVVTDNRDKGRLQRYKYLTAAEAAIYIQIRTEKIGLNGFLKDRKVPNINAECSCGWERQTAKHIVMFCPEWQAQRRLLRDTIRFTDYSQLTDNKENAKALAKWFIGLNILDQFKGRLDEE